MYPTSLPARPSLLQVPGVEDLSAFDTYGVPAILVAVMVVLGLLFYKRIIVWGATCDLLLDAEREKTEAAKGEARASKEDLVRVADEFNANFKLVVTELTASNKERRDA